MHCQKKNMAVNQPGVVKAYNSCKGCLIMVLKTGLYHIIEYPSKQRNGILMAFPHI